MFSLLLVSSAYCMSVSCNTVKQADTESLYTYYPDDKKLFDTIVALDSIFFNAYNTCNVNLEKYASFYSDSIEFYHDQGGVMYSKKDVVASTEKFVCGKVTRELVPNSIEVYPIKGYGAVEMGLHKFRNNSNPPGTIPETGRFIIIWQHKNNEWKIARVISLH